MDDVPPKETVHIRFVLHFNKKILTCLLAWASEHEAHSRRTQYDKYILCNIAWRSHVEYIHVELHRLHVALEQLFNEGIISYTKYYYHRWRCVVFYLQVLRHCWNGNCSLGDFIKMVISIYNVVGKCYAAAICQQSLSRGEKIQARRTAVKPDEHAGGNARAGCGSHYTLWILITVLSSLGSIFVC